MIIKGCDNMDQNIKAFLRVLDASDNSTGGGTASGIAGAMAAGLAAMVARLSIGKKDLAPREHYEKIATQAEAIAGKLFSGGREDAAAFDRVSSAYKLPKETDENKASRSLEIQKAMVYATEVPLCVLSPGHSYGCLRLPTIEQELESIAPSVCVHSATGPPGQLQ